MSYLELESIRKILRPVPCQMMIALHAELQMTEDRIEGEGESEPDDPKFAEVLTHDLTVREEVVTRENIEIMKKEVELTGRIMRFEAHHSGKTKSQKKLQEEKLIKEVQAHNKTVGALNKKRQSRCEKIVKKTYVNKWSKGMQSKCDEAESKVRANKDVIHSLKADIIPDEKNQGYVIVPNNSNVGNVKEYVKQINSGAVSTSKQIAIKGTLSLDEFKGLHDSISRDMKMTEYKGTISMSDIEFYSYDRVQVFKKIFECAQKDSITGRISKEDLGADITDICFIWLIRGTNFDKIKDGLNQVTKKRIETLISRYSFKNRTIDADTKNMARLQNDTLTVSRFCDLYPMRVWALWHNKDESQRPGYISYTNFSEHELKIIRSLRCPSLPYLCSKTREDKTKDLAPFKKLLAFHTYFLLDFDKLMYTWVKDRPNMPKEFKPRLGLISQIVKKKAMATDFVPNDQEKFTELQAVGLIRGNNASDMREDPDLVEKLVPIAQKIIRSVLSEQPAIESSLKDVLATLEDQRKIPDFTS